MASLFGPAASSDPNGTRRSLLGRSVGLIWLIFLALPLLGALDDRTTSSGHKVVVVALAAVFAVSFTAISLVPGDLNEPPTRRRVAAVLAVMWAITIFLVVYDRTAWDYEFIFSVFPAMRLLGARVLTVGGIAALAVAVGLITGLDAGDLIFLGFIIVGTGVSMVGVIHLIEANDELRAAQAVRARAAVAEERLRFARDLHDLLGHSLSVIALKSEVAAKVLAGDPVRAGREIDEIQAIARRALREVREAVSGYRATLAVELAGARSALSAAEVIWEEDLPAAPLSREVEAVLAWALREGVTNVVRHARASSCALRLELDGQRATVTVTDDGVGGAERDGRERGNGLRGLAERVASAGGQLEAGPRGGGGYRLRVSVPVAPPGRGATEVAPIPAGPAGGEPT